MSVIVNAPKRATRARQNHEVTQVELVRTLPVNKAVPFKSLYSARAMATAANGFLVDRRFQAYAAKDGKFYLARVS